MGMLYCLHSLSTSKHRPQRRGAGSVYNPPPGRYDWRLVKTYNTASGPAIPRALIGFFYIIGLLLLGLTLLWVPRGGASPNETLEAKPGVVIEPGTCGAGASADKTVLKTAPKDTQWVTTESGWTGPVSQTAGPVVGSPIRSCFEHSAQGALYAAAWAVIHVNDSPEAYMPTVIGPGAEQITKERLQDTKTRTVVRIMGYRYMSYTPERAVIRILFQTPSGTYRYFETTLEWHNGDWALWVPAEQPQVTDEYDKGKYVTWKAA